jgi:hypothetical protein
MPRSHCLNALLQQRSIRSLIPMSVYFNLFMLPWFFPVWTMATAARWLVNQPILSEDLCQSRFRRCYSSSGFVALTILLKPLLAFIGCECRRIKYVICFVQTLQLALSGVSLQYLSQFVCLSNVPSRRRFRSTASDRLLISGVRHWWPLNLNRWCQNLERPFEEYILRRHLAIKNYLFRLSYKPIFWLYYCLQWSLR